MGAVIRLQGRRPIEPIKPMEPMEPMEPLWRDVLGARLRAERRRQELTLTDVADRAGVSTQYLSEIERGRKEPSSEIVAAVGSALGLTLLDLTSGVARTLHDHRTLHAHRTVHDHRALHDHRFRTAHPRPTGPVCLAA